MLQNITQPSKFKARMGSSKPFMNPAASHPENRGTLQGVVQKWEVFTEKRVGKGAISERKD